MHSGHFTFFLQSTRGLLVASTAAVSSAFLPSTVPLFPRLDDCVLYSPPRHAIRSPIANRRFVFSFLSRRSLAALLLKHAWDLHSSRAVCLNRGCRLACLWWCGSSVGLEPSYTSRGGTMLLCRSPVSLGRTALAGGIQCIVAPSRRARHIVVLGFFFLVAQLARAETGELGNSASDQRLVASASRQLSGTVNAESQEEHRTDSQEGLGSAASTASGSADDRSEDGKARRDKVSSDPRADSRDTPEWLAAGASMLANTLGSLSVPVPEGVASDTARTFKGAVHKLKTALTASGADGEIGLKRRPLFRGGPEALLLSNDAFAPQRQGRPPLSPRPVPPRNVTPFLEQKAKKMVLLLDWYTKTIAATMTGRRPQDEDAMIVQAPLQNYPKMRLKAIFDGHGGHQVSRRAVSVANQYIGTMPDLTQESFQSACLELDRDMRRDHLKGGSTGLMVTIEQVDDPEAEHGISFTLRVANVGDSRGLVLHQDGTFTVLSKDHKPTQVVERLRIKNAGGFLLRRVGVWRVDGRLALSRAFGDFGLKNRDDMPADKQKIVAVPDLIVAKAYPGDVILMGCDGIFERPEMDWQFVADLLRDEMAEADGGLAEVAYRILDSAFMLGSRDNMSVMLTKLVKKPITQTEVRRFDYNFAGERVVLPSQILPGKPSDERSGRYGTGDETVVTLF